LRKLQGLQRFEGNSSNKGNNLLFVELVEGESTPTSHETLAHEQAVGMKSRQSGIRVTDENIGANMDYIKRQMKNLMRCHKIGNITQPSKLAENIHRCKKNIDR
jgi:hypothetical protein